MDSASVTQLYTKEQSTILNVKPGITDYASIEFRNENELLSKVDDPEAYYIKEIIPVKVNLSRKFADHPSLKRYFSILFRTVIKVFFH